MASQEVFKVPAIVTMHQSKGTAKDGMDEVAAARVDTAPVEFVTVLLNNIGKLLGWTAAGLGLGLAGGLLLGGHYTAISRFQPEGPNTSSGGLGGVASQFGFTVPGLEQTTPLEFYTTLLDSDDLLLEALRREIPFMRGDSLASVPVIRTLEVPEDDPAEGVETLRSQMTAAVESEANLVRLDVRSPRAETAREINRLLIELVNEFNLEKRQTRAREEVQFIKERLEEARVQLHAAEDELQDFLTQNRRVESPELIFEEGRIQRRMDVARGVFLELSQALERAQIEQVRTTPVITVVDGPEGLVPYESSYVKWGVLGALVGLLAAATAVFWRRYVGILDQQAPQQLAELRSAWRGSVLGGLWK